MSDSRLNRRRFVAAASVAGIAGVAGCSEADAPAATGDGDTLYVGPDGNDDNPGTESEPVATIEYALEAAVPGETVHVLPGTYYQNLWINEDRTGQPGDPITLTGPPDAVLKSANKSGPIINVIESHFHLTGLTIDGLLDPDRPDEPDSYVETQLIGVAPRDPDPQDPEYIENLVLSPHRMGNTQSAFINVALLKDSEIGGFEVIGPAGTYWVLDNEPGKEPVGKRQAHNGEFVYLGTAPPNLERNQGIQTYDETRNIRVHHIDNSAGHLHGEMVECKNGVRDITIEYCTDAWGARHGYEDDRHQNVKLRGENITVRWNYIRGTRGDPVSVGPQNFYLPEIDDPGEWWLAPPETEQERRMGTENAIYGNHLAEYTYKAIRYFRDERLPEDRDDRADESDQEVVCGNAYDSDTDGTPDRECSNDVPDADRIGHLGGDSPWADDVSDSVTVPELIGEAAVEIVDVSLADETVVGEPAEAVVTLQNTGDAHGHQWVELRYDEWVHDSHPAEVRAGEERAVTLTTNDFESGGPGEYQFLLNGEEIGTVTVTDS